jgi:hypothetical protein
MEGGMMWDCSNVQDTLKTIRWISENQQATNEAIPWELPEILDRLEDMGEVNDGRLGSQDELQQAIQQLRDLGCKCALRKCNQNCSCKVKERRCTLWCAQHPATPQQESNFGCMYEVVY